MEYMLSVFSPRTLHQYQKLRYRGGKPLQGVFEDCIEEHMDYAMQWRYALADLEKLQC